MSFFDAHEEGCKPLDPCRVCRALEFLKKNLKPQQFSDYLKIMDGGKLKAVAASSSDIPVTAESKAVDVMSNDGPIGRVKRALMNSSGHDITIGQIQKMDDVSLLAINDLGRVSLGYLDAWLGDHGLARSPQNP